MVEPEGVERDHEEYRELLGAYALGATTPEERRALAAHLATCQTCPAELARLWAAVHALPLALEDREPPPLLRDRIQAAVLRDLAEQKPPSTPGRFRWGLASRRLPISPWAAAAALLLAFSLGMLLWNLRLQQAVQRQGVVETVALQPADPASGASGHLTYLEDQRVLILTVRDLPPLAPGQVYEAWLIPNDGAPVPAGVFDRPTARHAIAADLAEYQALAITAEPGPLGSLSPTGAPLAQAPLAPS